MIEMNGLYYTLLCYAFFLCCFIPIWVAFVMGWQFYTGRGIASVGNESNLLEFAWTVIPTASVTVLCLYNVTSMILPAESVNYEAVLIIGNQWYWNYMMELSGESFDSIMLDFIDTVDKPLRLIYKVPYELLVSSADVIHSFSVPDFNIKLDGIPGRLNNVTFFPDRMGVFVGYCSELCGAGHAYMPIVLEVVNGKPVV